MLKLTCLTLGLALAACQSTPREAEVSAKQAPPLNLNALPAATPGAAQSATQGAPLKESAGGLVWHAEAPLVARAPKSAMRVAEYTLSADPRAELAVFYFGEGQGGAVEPNITRWLGQFTQADGSSTDAHAKRSERTTSGMKVSLVEASGKYAGGMAMPGAPAPEPQDDAMLLGAIVEGPAGPVFFKLVGKRESLVAARAGFDALIDSIKKSP